MELERPVLEDFRGGESQSHYNFHAFDPGGKVNLKYNDKLVTEASLKVLHQGSPDGKEHTGYEKIRVALQDN